VGRTGSPVSQCRSGVTSVNFSTSAQFGMTTKDCSGRRHCRYLSEKASVMATTRWARRAMDRSMPSASRPPRAAGRAGSLLRSVSWMAAE
jgi:hypothetical protein